MDGEQNVRQKYSIIFKLDNSKLPKIDWQTDKSEIMEVNSAIQSVNCASRLKNGQRPASFYENLVV